ncbi:hypothetical protein HSRCO_2880 [Halanaeroarchaeum sp. HSR-CO]|uniref:hypothetical protein n=1 Tax=Halanaeroarchaeum sp. HSR-CO TaxID=2866382 RepID=UPI00217DBA00|nr:hypothetical protein [Halanaeroarchaeum sp. HSR-CO]UWG49136.1 hypothetical protein HSRCO_2880 [Halanaeroarchaeum sp. HSR-CO]
MTDGIGTRSGWRRRARLGVALGTLVAGVIVLASGAAKMGGEALSDAGFSAGMAIEVAAAGAAALPIVIFVAVLATVDADYRFQRFAVVGGTLTIGGIAVAVTSTTPLANPVSIGLYGGGVAVLLGALVGGVLDAFASGTGSDRTNVDYVDRRPTDHAMPSDGGEEDDDLEFLLDDEE